MKRPTATALLLALVCASASAQTVSPRPSGDQPPASGLQPPASDLQPPTPRFRSAVDLVSVAAVVRDRKGRFVRNLRKEDFVVEERGARRDLIDLRADDNAPVRVALLFDVSGSMQLASRLEDARAAARQVLSALRLADATDEAAVFSFDMNLQSLQPFTADAGAIERALARVAPYGQTSLYDAIALTASDVNDSRPGDPRRRAVIVFTDGVDTSSSLTAQRVAEIAGGIDVPVYVMTVVSNVDRDKGAASEQAEGPLRDLARATGGDLFVTSAPAHESIAARQIVDEMRHQYLMSFEAAPGAGWHGLSVKTRDKDFVVRARSGYRAGAHIGS